MKKITSLQDVKLVQIESVEKPPFLNLQQLYEFEFSPITGNVTDKNGLYDSKELQASWHHQFDAYLFYLDDLPIGLAVINLSSQIDNNPNARDIAEFFVMPNYRHHGIGEAMGIKLFDKYPGKWEVRQLFKAEKARNFWLKVIDKYTKGNYKEFKYDNQSWRGYVQEFLSRNK